MESINFDFMKDRNEKYYITLCGIEEDARIHPQPAAAKCRKLLESFLTEIEQEESIKRYRGEAVACLKENPKFNKDNAAGRLQILDWLRKNKTDVGSCLPELRMDFKRRGIVFRPDLASIGGNYRGYDYLRMLGNAGSHSENKRNQIEPNEKNVLMALELYHALFMKYYSLENTVEPFDESKVPLGKYYVIDEREKKNNSCTKEYHCFYYEGPSSRIKKYAIVRKYSGDEIKDNRAFYTRAVDAYSELSTKSFGSEYEVDVKEIVPIEDSEESGYYVAYEFKRDIMPLSRDFFEEQKLSIRDRVLICERIADQLFVMHKAVEPIYHRSLSFDSIVISDYRDLPNGFVPYIINFDYVKLTNANITVIDYMKQADSSRNKEDPQTHLLWRYRSKDSYNDDAKWDKVDIYALGVLMMDVLLEQITSKPISSKEFDDLERKLFLSEATINLIDEMLCESPDGRPDMSEVKKIIDAEYLRWI